MPEIRSPTTVLYLRMPKIMTVAVRIVQLLSKGVDTKAAIVLILRVNIYLKE